MKSHPILFNSDMVRAILEGRKTMTRRLVKTKVPIQEGWKLMTCCSTTGDSRNVGRHQFGDIKNACQEIGKSCTEYFSSPYGYVGDRLWVKETHAIAKDTKGFPYLIYKADCVEDDSGERIGYWKGEQFFPGGFKWIPSIHLPRLSSRITLEITNVRVERVQEINEKDSQCEGFEQYSTVCARHKIVTPCCQQFARTWIKLYPDSWERNDWVWIYEFKRVEAI